ncbi:hypothetical protein [Fibrella aquatilis]|uniref:Uncharacterized protein n=1 Tax=Fibrella aquatilis TaxID=2817059 RepID=A0A939G0N6_9BACT|nr:hypothetical protein [Fibrella aquatilis]MBO0929779.1 hypothetical protein [Fibrella aquatilis]
MLTITLKPAQDLKAHELTALYSLARRTGFPLANNYIESAHFVYNPTVVMAHSGDQLLGFQSYNTYRLRTPFFRGEVPFIYGGLAFQDYALAGRGLGYRLSRYYMRQTLGRLFFLRPYAFAIRTPTPRLMQILAVQHQLVHFKNGLLTPDVLQFALHFVRNVRRFEYPIDDRLVVRGEPVHADISEQWSRLFGASEAAYNQLAYEADLVRVEGGSHFLTGNYLLLLGHSSWRKLWGSLWT